jgi:hypothetical protein
MQSVMGELDFYIYNCVISGKKPGGVKISNLKKSGHTQTLSDTELFCLARNIDVPMCPICKASTLKVKSLSGGEFTEYCSMTCYAKILSERNILNNCELNERQRHKRDSEKRSQLDSINLAIKEYASDKNCRIKDLASKYSISYTYFRNELISRGLIDKSRGRDVYRKNLEKRLETQNALLENDQWVRDKLSRNWSTKMIANEIGCSANYVAVKTRNMGIPFPNNKSISSREIILKEYLENEGYRVETNDRKILNGKEIDIFLPDYNIGIEVNGVFWHQFIENSNKGKNSDANYHKNKTAEAANRGVTLIHVYDYEIDDPIKLEKIKSIIKSKTGRNKRVFARHCEIREISSMDYKNFLNDNHFKGSISSKIRIGLFYRNEMVSCIGISKPRFNKKYEWELIRLCNKRDITVIGGVNKMISFFIKKCSPSSIISYCDKRLFSGNVYEKIGMKCVNTSNSNYQWVKYNGSGRVDIVSRYQAQKHKICTEETKHLSENDIMRSKNYMKIYDCGQDTWALILSAASAALASESSYSR